MGERSAQAAMETEPAGAIPHCCFVDLSPQRQQRKRREEEEEEEAH